VQRRRFVLVLLLFVVPAAGAGCSLFTGARAAADTPELAFGRLQNALQSRDWSAVYAAAVAPSTQKSFEADFQSAKRQLVEKSGEKMFAESIGLSREEYLRMTAREFFVKMSSDAGKATGFVMLPEPESVRNGKILDAKVEDEEAMLTVELEGVPRRMFFVREDARWYFKSLDFD
jgi:hypothetical protein